MLTMILSNLIWSEGQAILFVLAALTAIALTVWRPLLVFVGLSFLCCFYFFRNPVRTSQVPIDDTVILCPADGTVLAVEQIKNDQIYTQKVAIFLSVFDVHVNWMPVSGIIKSIEYIPGSFELAFLTSSSHNNERNEVVLEHTYGQLEVRQIAGMIARRIVCWIKPGDAVAIGQKYGMIRFGSRVEILLPENVEVAVHQGQKVYGGHTLLGRWRNS
jgi:phosphatidylserine decarboxylase